MRIYNKLFNKIMEPENLFLAWDEFKKGKRQKLDVLRFEKNLEQNIFQLQRDLRDKTYKHGGYTSFYIHDPKLRHIHKATVRDRVLHHAVFKILNPIFEPIYIHNSFSCRIGKGNHKGVKTLAHLLRQAEKIIASFSGGQSNLFQGKGVPIGNLNSQLFANIYMNEFDQFMRHDLKVKYYARYTDDFVIVSDYKNYLEKLLTPIQLFLREKLKLELHPSKVSIRKYRQGIDFLGYVALPHYISLRTKTKKRMMWKLRDKMADYKNEKINKGSLTASFQSYLGVLYHADAHELTEDLQNKFWFWLNE
jgi:retron-type reverse transcriptase